MEKFAPSPNNLSDVISILKNRSAAVRTEEDLFCIGNALDPVLSAADVVWGALSAHQKLVLCKYFELKTVFDSEGQVLCVERRVGIVKNEDQYTGGLYVLIHGRATISISGGGPSLLVHARGSQLGKVLGRLSVPSEDASVFFKEVDANGRAKSTYHRFVSPQNRQGNDVNIRFEKGSTYIVLPESQSRQFLARLNASLIANRVFNDIGMVKLLCKQKHEKGCTHASLIDGECKTTKVFQFRAGQILIREGDASDQVVFVATGSCFIFRHNEDQEVHCVGSLLAPCFVGVTTLFGGSGSSQQPVSVVAATDGYTFSFCSYCFYTFVDRMLSKLMNAFQVLAESQMTAWGVKAEKEKEVMVTRKETVGAKKRSRPRTVTRRKSSLLTELLFPAKESTKENSVNVNVSNEETDMSNGVFENLLSRKLNKSKLLAAMHEKLSNDLGEDGVDDRDVVHDRDEWLIDGDKTNILADVMKALSEGCGVDFAKCEGNDPFHNFFVEKPAETKETKTTTSDLQMLLKMPFRMPNRLHNMADECLGRKRPPEYDDSDSFLKPCDSVVSRKMHGKTLPVVRQVQCVGPFETKLNEAE